MIRIILVTPRSSRNHIIAQPDGSYKVKLTAPPVDGEANKKLIAFLSKEWDVPKLKIKIVSGMAGRKKTIEIMK